MLNKILIVLSLLFILISCDMSAKEYSKEEIKSKNIKYIEELNFFDETIYIIVWNILKLKNNI